jgi:hypothetical protein
MKKSILAFAIALSALLGINQSASAADHSRDEITTLTTISNINKIEVHGNVELYLSDGMTDQVKVFNKYYSENALIQSENGVLKISSYKAQKLVVWITVTNLGDLSVYDNAQVKSFGKLSAINLDVKMYDNASAQLNMDAYAVSLKLNGHTAADIEGTITEAELNYDRSASLNTTNLNSDHLVRKLNKAEDNTIVEL